MEPDEDEATTPFDASADQDDDDDDQDDDDLPEVVDLSGVESASYEPIPRGTYDGWVESIEYGPSQSSGAPMLTWILKLMYDAYDGKGERERTLRYYTTLKGEGAGRTKATLARLDPDLDLANILPGEMDEHFSGLEIRIRVTVRPDRDDRRIKRNNVADIFPADEEEE